MPSLLALIRNMGRSGRASPDGSRELTFADGRCLRVPARDDQYEAWNMTGPRGLRIVSMGGGELVVWSPTDAPPTGFDAPSP